MKTRVIIFFLFFVNLLNAQYLGPKWISILDLPDHVVYVDTSSIRQVENQVSVLSVSIYKEPQLIPSLNKEAVSVKSQILFNAALEKFTVIGTLYYDKNLKILGETSLPGFASSSENFSVPIEGNKEMTVIYNKAVEYLNIGLSPVGEKEAAKADVKKEEVKKEIVKITPAVKEKIDATKKIETDSLKALDRVALYLSKKDSVQKAASQQPQVEQIPSVEKNNVDSSEANEKEISPRTAIFSDGSKYSFQVSSWKNKTKAELETKKLKNAGHNAFISEGIVRGSTWYRVRIGYFNSVEETKSYMKKVKSE